MATARVACARVVAAVLQQQSSLATLLPTWSSKVERREQGLLQELCYGTLRWYPRLERILQHLLAKPLKAADADLQALLACTLYQILETRIPAHAAVNEAVIACNSLKKAWARGMVNGVLRRYLREQSTIAQALEPDPVYSTAHPQWLLERLRRVWPNRLGEIVAANNSRPPMTLRVNLRRGSRQQYLERLQQADIPASATCFSDGGVQLQAPVPVEQLPGFSDGDVSVQDESAQLAAMLLDLQPGQRVLDACCAPGGKTGHMLEREPQLKELLAVDVEPKRLERVDDNLRRLGLRAHLLTADAGRPETWWDGKPFDRILLDAPCSATGVIRRNPDIKLLRRAEDIGNLADLQLKLLKALWPTLGFGGKLLYATCSVLPEENQAVIGNFCAGQKDACELPISSAWGVASYPGRQLLPNVNSHDGFFYALLEKQEQLVCVP